MTKKSLITIHPGEFLAETLGELGLSQAAFARAIGVSPMRISHVVKGTQPVTAVEAIPMNRGVSAAPGAVATGAVDPVGRRFDAARTPRSP